MELLSVETVFRALNDAGVQYIVVGGLAVNAHGYERLTNDIDLVIGFESANFEKGIRSLLSIGYQFSVPVTLEEFTDAACRAKWKNEKNMVVLRLWSPEHARTVVDVFTTEPFDFATEYPQTQQLELGGKLRIPVLRYASLIEMKKAAGRPRDLQDVEYLQRLDQHREET